MLVAPVLWSLPFVLPPIVALARSTHSRSLADVTDAVPDGAPLVSVVVPARNEARNIERCVRSLLAARYPSLEVIVVDDHSEDETRRIAEDVASTDARLRVIGAPPLAAGWFGKQWACVAGAREGRGDLLLFTDADTRHGPDLLPRAVNALLDEQVDLLSLAGHQEMHSFWERVVQPQMFALLALRYGGTEHVSHARRAVDVIANGQFILVRRTAYDAVGGHERVRDQVAEDMALAQSFVRDGHRLLLLLAMQQFSTHMYASLDELIRGWRKNIYAGGRNAALGGALGRAAYPFLLLLMPILGFGPPIALVLAVLGVLSTAWLVWSVIVVAFALVFWIPIYRFMGEPAWYALLYPLGFAMLLYIAAGAVRRGRNVEWKARTYTAS